MNVSVGNAVLAGIAASDALCCLRLGRRSRDASHDSAVTLLAQVDRRLAQDLQVLLSLKDLAHYSEKYVNAERHRRALRCAERLVEAAKTALVT